MSDVQKELVDIGDRLDKVAKEELPCDEVKTRVEQARDLVRDVVSDYEEVEAQRIGKALAGWGVL